MSISSSTRMKPSYQNRLKSLVLFLAFWISMEKFHSGFCSLPQLCFFLGPIVLVVCFPSCNYAGIISLWAAIFLSFLHNCNGGLVPWYNFFVGFVFFARRCFFLIWKWGFMWFLSILSAAIFLFYGFWDGVNMLFSCSKHVLYRKTPFTHLL